MLTTLVPLQAGINFTGINVLLGLIGGVVTCVVGIAIIHSSRKGGFRKAAESGGAAMIGVFIFALGLSFAIAAGAAGAAISYFFQG